VLLTGVDAAGARLVPARRQIRPCQVRRLLLIRRERFGDAITMLPAIARARELFPQARITWMLDAAYARFFRCLAVVDEIWTVPHWRAFLPRWPRFDLALDFHADLRTLVVGRVQARRLAGFGIRGGDFLLDVFPQFPWRDDAATRHVRLVESAAGADPAPVPPPRMPRSIWEPPRYAPSPGYVLVHPGAGQPGKQWPRRNWVALLRRLRQDNLRVLLTGSVAETVLCRSLAPAAAGSVEDWSGRTGWESLAALVAGAAAVVAADTGIAHLAQALGTPAVVLFGPNDPAVWGYRHAPYRALAQPLACSHCARARCPRVPAGWVSPCMDAITVESVVAALLGALRARSAGQAG